MDRKTLSVFLPDDTDLPETAELFETLIDIADPPALPDQDMVTYVDDLTLELPVELQLGRAESGKLQVRMAPPTQTTSTSVFPVMHTLRIHVAKNHD